MEASEAPTFISLFAGIGGIDIGLERAGWACRGQVEWDAYCQRVLAKHWPNVRRWGDITTVDWGDVERVDLLAGGFPCQPVSIAGKGRAQADERWLWPEFYRAIRELGPSHVLVENVPGLLGRGLDVVLGDLATIGYDAEWQILSAAAVGAPHRRERVWITAHRAGPLADAAGERRGQTGNGHAVAVGGDGAQAWPPLLDADGAGQRVAGARDAGGWQHQGGPNVGGPAAGTGGQGRGAGGRGAQPADAPDPDAPRERLEGLGAARATASPVDRPSDGGSASWWAAEPSVGRVAHGVPHRVDRLRALGNAVVPQAAEVFGRAIRERHYGR